MITAAYYTEYGKVKRVRSILREYNVFGLFRAEKRGNFFSGVIDGFGGSYPERMRTSSGISAEIFYTACHTFRHLGRFGKSSGGVVEVYHIPPIEILLFPSSLYGLRREAKRNVEAKLKKPPRRSGNLRHILVHAPFVPRYLCFPKAVLLL
jgi:hypothetical protein